MMRLEGDELIELSREQLWQSLVDMDFLARCVPDLDRVVCSEPERLVCRVKPGFAFLRGSLEVTFEVTDRQPPESAQMQVRSKGIGSTVSVALNFRLEDAGKGEEGPTSATRLHWTAEIGELGGLLKPVSPDLIQAAARRIVVQIWSNVRKQLAA